MSKFPGMVTFMDSVVVRNPDRLLDLTLTDGWGHNREFLDVFRNLNVKSFGQFIREQSSLGSYDYIRIYVVGQDILAMMEAMQRVPYSKSSSTGDKDVLNWKEIFEIIFDDEAYMDLLSVTREVMTVALKIIMRGFLGILGGEFSRKLPPEVWELIVIHCISDGNGGRSFELPTVFSEKCSQKRELELLAKVIKSMGHIHMLLSRIAFFGNYVSCGGSEIDLGYFGSAACNEVRPHFDWRKLKMKRNVCELLSHISEVGPRCLPNNLAGNLAALWKGSMKTSSYAALIHPETVAFCEGISSLAVLVSDDNFWDPADIDYGTATICDLESSKIIIRIRLAARLIVMSRHGFRFHLSRQEMLFAHTESDEYDFACIRQWKYDDSGCDEEKFHVDKKFKLAPSLLFPKNGYLGFLVWNGTNVIGICAHNANVGENFSKLILVNSSSGQKMVSVDVPHARFEILAMKHSRILLADNGHRDVIFCAIESEGMQHWRQQCFKEESNCWSLVSKFDAHPETRQFVVLGKEGGDAPKYEVFMYDDDKWSEPIRIFNGTLSLILRTLDSRSTELLNGCIYIFRENMNVSCCECLQRKAVLGFELLAINCSDATMHPMDTLAGGHVCVPVTALNYCGKPQCDRRILINEANPNFMLFFSFDRFCGIHLTTEKKLLVDWTCFENGFAEPRDFVTVNFQ